MKLDVQTIHSHITPKTRGQIWRLGDNTDEQTIPRSILKDSGVDKAASSVDDAVGGTKSSVNAALDLDQVERVRSTSSSALDAVTKRQNGSMCVARDPRLHAEPARGTAKKKRIISADASGPLPSV